MIGPESRRLAVNAAPWLVTAGLAMFAASFCSTGPLVLLAMTLTIAVFVITCPGRLAWGSFRWRS